MMQHTLRPLQKTTCRLRLFNWAGIASTLLLLLVEPVYSQSSGSPTDRSTPDRLMPVNAAEVNASPSQVVIPIADLEQTQLPALDESYTLGAGDRIHLDFFSIPEYTGDAQVLADGTLNLPLIGNVSVKGKTLHSAADAIETAYGQLLRNPIVTVSLIRPRPLRVGIAGEVNRPGSYAMSLRAAEGDAEEFQWPTVTQVIQAAGGITQQADVSQIRVQRIQESGELKEINIDLWELLRDADLSQDMPLRDGDNITIPVARSLQPAEATQLSSASFAPDTIQVSVIGEVMSPGLVEVPPNTPLNQALLVAGGFDRRRAKTSQVELVRLNPDGTVTQRSVPIDFTRGISEESNPILRNNDVVVVGRSGSAQFSDSMNGVLETLGRILPFFTLF
jgi:polysaccharide export outer membrane protein